MKLYISAITERRQSSSVEQLVHSDLFSGASVSCPDLAASTLQVNQLSVTTNPNQPHLGPANCQDVS